MTDRAEPPATPTMGRAVYVRDDLDGYGAILHWEGPPRAEGEVVAVTNVTMGYDPASLTIATVTIAYPGRPTFPAPSLPTAGESVEAWATRTGAPGQMTDAGDVLLVTLRLDMTATDVQAVLAGAPVGRHAQGLLATLATLRRVAATQWRAELKRDEAWPTRPLASVVRDREALPSPDPVQVEQDQARIWDDLQALDDLHALVSQVLEQGPAPETVTPTPSNPIPTDLPTQTSPPVDTVSKALADGRSGRNWGQDDVTGEPVHKRPGASGQARVVETDATETMPAWTRPASEATLTRGGLNALSALQTAIGMTRDAYVRTGVGTVQVELDHLARVIGLRARTHTERMRHRRDVHDYLRLIAAIRVETDEPRVPVRERGKVVQMSWRSSLIVIEEVLLDVEDGQITIDGTGRVPRAVRFRGSDRLFRHARLGNRALPVLGKGNRLDAIPAGQPSGSWARGIGYAAIYHGRRIANHSVSLTREQWLTTYPGDPHPLDLTGNPKRAGRAVEYWTQALDILRTLPGGPLIASMVDPDPPKGRGWVQAWLRQDVLVRLHRDAPEVFGLDAVQAGRADHAAAEQARRRPGRPRSAPTAL